MFASIFSAAPQTALLLQASQGGLGSIIGFLPLILIFVVFYFMLIRPQQKRQREWQEKLTTLKAGDLVVTSGGIRGTVISVKDEAVHVRIPPDNLRLEIMKSAVVSFTTADDRS